VPVVEGGYAAAMDERPETERDRVEVVVGEGDPSRRGLLRFVLDGEGFAVVAEATTTVELVHALAVHRPDVVVLDDGIGATAIAVTREMIPSAKVVLVWPAGVVAIRGDARVDPAGLLNELAPAIERVLGIVDEPVRMGTVRRLPPRVGSPPGDGSDPHPSGLGPIARVIPGPGLPRPEADPGAGDAIIVDREPAPLLILPVAQWEDRDPD
jgi:hypothetical protein